MALGVTVSIKLSILALLGTEPMYGAQLRQEFEARTGGTWPLNVGQVYSTLGRLERDGLVEGEGEPDVEGRIAYRLTPLGRATVARWWVEPVPHDQTPRNELAIKLAIAVTVPGVDVQRIVQAQRVATMTHLRDLTLLKRQQSGEDLAWELVLESLVFADEAELRWLDHVEARLAQMDPPVVKASPTAPAASAKTDGSREPARS